MHRLLGSLSALLALMPVDAAVVDEVAAVNRLRQSVGLPVLAASDTLARAAAAHADYLDRHREPGPEPSGASAHLQQVGREGFVGETPAARALAVGYPHGDVRENVTMGYDALADALDGLMGAVYHRFTFLDLTADEIGAFSSENARVFLLGRRDVSELCRQPPGEALFQTPVDCLGQPMTREYYQSLCADLPAEAAWKAPHPMRCGNGQILDADFMRRLCDAPPAEALPGDGTQAGFYTPCGQRGPRIDAAWFDRLCAAPPNGAAYTASGHYYELCEPPRKVSPQWLGGLCAALPESARYRETGRYRRPCSAPHELRAEFLEELDAAALRRLPEVVVWPPEDATDIPPAFFIEEPDPLPDIEVSGYPVSIQFNPAAVGVVEVEGFELMRIDGARPAPVGQVRLMDDGRDPHGLLGTHEFVLFPLERLAWGGRYQASVRARLDGAPRQYRWRFQVRDPGLPLLTVEAARERFVIQSGRTHLLYAPPLPDHPHTVLRTRIEHLRGNHVNLQVVDPNTLKLDIEARYCDRMRIGLDDGRVAELIPAGCEIGADAGGAVMTNRHSGG